ncbi:MAG: hypothetical protein GYA61_02595 [Spirochaetales bacterium]|nr:hypothetical protein [Spirochaetales bacterium]
MAKSSLQQLIEETGIDPKLAKSLLIFTGGDVEGAKKIISSFEKNIGCLVVKFSLNSIKAYGLIILLINLHQNKLEKMYMTVSDNPQLMSVDLLKDTNEIKQLIRVTEITSDFNYIIKAIEDKLNNVKYLEKLYPILKSTNQEHLSEAIINFFSSLLNEITTEVNIIIKHRYTQIDPFEMGKIIAEAAEEVSEESQNTENNQEKKESFSNNQLSFIELECEPIYSPIKGIDVGILQEGDFLKVRISDDREIAQYLSKLLINIEEQSSDMINAKIISKENLYENLVKFIVEFGPGILGKVICGTDVKIEADISGKRLNEVKDFQTHGKKSIKKRKTMTSNVLLMVIGAIVVFFIIMILVLTM